MKKINIFALNIFIILALTGCKKIVESYEVKIGDNSVTTTALVDDRFALGLSGSFPIEIKGQNYGSIDIVGASDDSPFSVSVTADFESLLPENWEGFGPTTVLPNGDPIPFWITPYELIAIDIPNFNDQFDITLYVGYKNPYYIGVAITLNILDNHYPEGLGISQLFRKSGNSPIWGSIQVFGPRKDDEGNITAHGGLFFIASFDPENQGTIRWEK